MGILSLLISAIAVLAELPDPLLRTGGRSLLLVLTLYVLGVAICYSAYVALRAQSAEQYARTSLAGRNASESLEVLAYESRAACLDFCVEVADLDKFLREEVLTRGQLRPSFEKQILASLSRQDGLLEQLDSLRSHNIKQERGLARLLRMKELAADRLGIPRRRLCDHVLQYSPQMHQELAQKFLVNWDVIVVAVTQTNGQALSPLTRNRIRSLARQNRRLVK